MSSFVDYALSALSLNVKDANPHHGSEEPLRVVLIERGQGATPGRELLNAASLIAAIEAFGAGVVALTFIDFAKISFTEQVSMVRNCDLLIGTHGAGLSHAVWLLPTAALIELTVGDRHFENLAKYAGTRYRGLPYDGTEQGIDHVIRIMRDLFPSLPS